MFLFKFGDLTCKVRLILTVPAAVTASHCVKGQQAESLKIVGGTNDITDMDSPTFAVREIIMNAYNDITKAARTFIHTLKNEIILRQGFFVFTMRLVYQSTDPR